MWTAVTDKACRCFSPCDRGCVGCRVLTVRDFTTVFDAYAQCEESLLTARIAMMDEDADEEEEEEKEVNKAIPQCISQRFVLGTLCVRRTPV